MSGRFLPGVAVVVPSRAALLAAVVLDREVGRYLEGWPAGERAAVLELVGALRAAGDAWRAGAASEVGSAEVAGAEVGASSARDLSVAEAACVLAVSEEWVRALARRGELGAHRAGPGRPWMLDAMAVAAVADDRRVAQ